MIDTPPMGAPVRCAAILAGGQSSRMGREKALLPYEGQLLVTRAVHHLKPLFENIVVVTANSQVAAAAHIPSIIDEFPGRGPLAGIQAALRYFDAPTFVVACDMPFLNADFIRHLQTQFLHSATDALVPRHENGVEPLHAIYSPCCLPRFEAWLQDKDTKMPSMRFVLSQINTVYIESERITEFGVSFENWNTPDDLPQ